MDLFVTRLQATHAPLELTPNGGLEINQFGPQFIEVSLAAPIAVGTLVNLTLELRGGARQPSLDAVGKVTSVTGTRAHVQLRQFDNDVWKDILEKLDTRQEHADKIFKKVKGES
ncbi:MAG: hypothetical protein KF767_18325 [Bdellovibrionaceae bacterium]|nr:hypothetical protein [Pseudobdellovibrionaceae bacterium]